MQDALPFRAATPFPSWRAARPLPASGRPLSLLPLLPVTVGPCPPIQSSVLVGTELRPRAAPPLAAAPLPALGVSVTCRREGAPSCRLAQRRASPTGRAPGPSPEGPTPAPGRVSLVTPTPMAGGTVGRWHERHAGGPRGRAGLHPHNSDGAGGRARRCRPPGTLRSECQSPPFGRCGNGEALGPQDAGLPFPVVRPGPQLRAGSKAAQPAPSTWAQRGLEPENGAMRHGAPRSCA